MLPSLLTLLLALAAPVSAIAPLKRPVKPADAVKRALPAKPADAPAGAFRATIHPMGDQTKCIYGEGYIQTCNYDLPGTFWFMMYGPTFFENADPIGGCMSLGNFQSGTTGLINPALNDYQLLLPCTQPWPQMGSWSNDPSPIKFMRRDDQIILSDQGNWCLGILNTDVVAVPCNSGDNTQKWAIKEHW